MTQKRIDRDAIYTGKDGRKVCLHDHDACEYRIFGRCLTCESHTANGCFADHQEASND